MHTQASFNKISDNNHRPVLIPINSEKSIIDLFPQAKQEAIDRLSGANAETPAGSPRPFPFTRYRRSTFVERITELIERNMEDENYDIDRLCREAGTNRTTLHYQLKRWTGLSTSFFIRHIRLSRAREILLTTDLNITQVAYEVGFRDPQYFSRVFTNSCGISPKVFRRRAETLEVI